MEIGGAAAVEDLAIEDLYFLDMAISLRVGYKPSLGSGHAAWQGEGVMLGCPSLRRVDASAIRTIDNRCDSYLRYLPIF